MEAGVGEPAVVLEAGLNNGAASWQWVMPLAFPRKFRAHWTRLQAELAAAAPQGRHAVVDGTGHQIPMDRPDVVADTILTVATQTQRTAAALAGYPGPFPASRPLNMRWPARKC